VGNEDFSVEDIAREGVTAVGVSLGRTMLRPLAVRWLAFEKHTGFFVYVGLGITGMLLDPLFWETAVTAYIIILYYQAPKPEIAWLMKVRLVTMPDHPIPELKVLVCRVAR
jgi:hypothetical protein